MSIKKESIYRDSFNNNNLNDAFPHKIFNKF